MSSWRRQLRQWLEAQAARGGSAWRAADDSSLALLAVAQALRFPGQAAFIVSDSRKANELASRLLEYAAVTGDPRPVELIPEVELGMRRQWIPENESARCAALYRLVSGEPGLFVVPVLALMAPAISPAQFRESVFSLSKGQSGLDPEALARKLVALDYDNEAEVGMPGEFARRGGILDFYSPLYDLPVRVEFFGDEIESLRFFSPSGQRSVREAERVVVVPRGLALLSEGGEGRVGDYLPPCLSTVVCEPELIEDHLEQFGDADDRRQWRWRHRALEARIELLGPLDVRNSIECLQADCQGLASALQADRRQGVLLWQDQGVRQQLLSWQKSGCQLVACCAGEAEEVRLRELLAAADDQEALALEFCTGMAGGVWIPGAGVALLSEWELFGRRQESRRSPRRHYDFRREDRTDWGTPEAGSLAVHALHGVCRYHGIQEVDVGGDLHEAAVLEFAGDAKVYLPLDQIDLLARYVGGTKELPKLARVGSASWKKSCAEATQATWDLAAEMLRFEAVRNHARKSGLHPVPEWEAAFAASFPYVETPDQARAISEVLEDQALARPMDRLLCGDVGYGKTEVAIRAAFRAVANRRQVAVLVPTTILAQQHYENFKRRMAEFPITIECVSRFKTWGEQKSILKRMMENQLDIVIGTHRLLQKDVFFDNLGLLVIDEEQRFGVEAKQRLKELRASVDILTMTATPIPRTLYLSLSGIRHLSTIMTAPVERLPVTTITATYDKKLIREAILRELEREGQVYYLHNRVRSIEKTAETLRQLVPEATIEVAHGQMDAADLEARMDRFVSGETDVLLSTTIIENGLDIPNANTIIVENAEKFGLSDLYQLRGRVGRYHNQAYAYLLLPPSGVLPTDARKRIAAIRKYTHLGAGFKLALQDLEIRGCGNILGYQQSGHIAAVGFDLYCKLLRESVARLENKPPPRRRQVAVHLPGLHFGTRTERDKQVAGIPRAYVGEEKSRLDLYRRLGDLADPAVLDDFRRELCDRFGPIPAEADRLLAITRIKILAALQGIHSVSVRDDFILLETEKGFRKGRDGQIPRTRAATADAQIAEVLALLQAQPR